MVGQTNGRRVPSWLVVVLACCSAVFTVWMWSKMGLGDVFSSNTVLARALGTDDVRPHLVLLDTQIRIDGEKVAVERLPIHCQAAERGLEQNITTLVVRGPGDSGALLKLPELCRYWASRFSDGPASKDEAPPDGLRPVASYVDAIDHPQRMETALTARAAAQARVRIDTFRLSLPDNAADPKLIEESARIAAENSQPFWDRFAAVAGEDHGVLVAFGLVTVPAESWIANDALAAYLSSLPKDRLSVLPTLAVTPVLSVAKLPGLNRAAIRRVSQDEYADVVLPRRTDQVDTDYLWAAPGAPRDLGSPGLFAPLDCRLGVCTARLKDHGLVVEQTLPPAALPDMTIEIDGWEMPLVVALNAMKPDVTSLPMVFDPRTQSIYVVQRHCRDAVCPKGAAWPQAIAGEG